MKRLLGTLLIFNLFAHYAKSNYQVIVITKDPQYDSISKTFTEIKLLNEFLTTIDSVEELNINCNSFENTIAFEMKNIFANKVVIKSNTRKTKVITINNIRTQICYLESRYAKIYFKGKYLSIESCFCGVHGLLFLDSCNNINEICGQIFGKRVKINIEKCQNVDHVIFNANNLIKKCRLLLYCNQPLNCCVEKNIKVFDKRKVRLHFNC